MNQRKSKLILFDIDGTLISAGGAGTRSMNRAFNDLFNIPEAFGQVSMAGKTDIQIIREGLKLHGFAHLDGNVDRMKQRYLHFLETEIHNPQRRLQPGVREVLGKCSEAGFAIGLLTGNLEQGAKIKLTPFGIYDMFLDGAFGSDNEDRDRLLPIARSKFRKKGMSYAPEDCIVVGDTPRDVQCAKVHGAACIAVATGPYSKADLLSTEADHVLDSLADAEKFVDLIMAR